MIESIKEAIDDLAHHLSELRRRFRATARVEVGRAVGGTLHDLAVDAICGRTALPSRTDYDDWDDPWEASPASSGRHPDDTAVAGDADRVAVRIRGAFLAGLTAGRWALRRTRQPVLAAAIGLLVGLAALLGGPTIERSIEAWLSAHELFGSSALNA